VEAVVGDVQYRPVIIECPRGAEVSRIQSTASRANVLHGRLDVFGDNHASPRDGVRYRASETPDSAHRLAKQAWSCRCSPECKKATADAERHGELPYEVNSERLQRAYVAAQATGVIRLGRDLPV
jgi:hypothetical protein